MLKDLNGDGTWRLSLSQGLRPNSETEVSSIRNRRPIQASYFLRKLTWVRNMDAMAFTLSCRELGVFRPAMGVVGWAIRGDHHIQTHLPRDLPSWL